jgi:uncharacterized protein RhaS with RHS repeats
MQQRYYDPGIGRFLSVDPVSTNANNGANFSRYWYGNNNPYRFTDPDGRLVKEVQNAVAGWCSTTSDAAQLNAYATSPYTGNENAAESSRNQLAVQGTKAGGAIAGATVVGTGVAVVALAGAPVVADVAGSQAVRQVAGEAIPVAKAGLNAVKSQVATAVTVAATHGEQVVSALEALNPLSMPGPGSAGLAVGTANMISSFLGGPALSLDNDGLHLAW